MNSVVNARGRSYGIAVLITGFVILLSLLFRPLVASAPYIIFFVAVALSAGIGGLGPGLVAAAISAVAVDYFFIPPYDFLTFTPLDLLRIAVFMAVAAVVSTVYAMRKRAEEVAFEQREQL